MQKTMEGGAAAAAAAVSYALFHAHTRLTDTVTE